MRLGQRFARLVTTLAVRSPLAWRLLRAPLRRNFDRLAPDWETRITDRYVASLEAALAEVDTPPRRILDVGTGSGAAARIAAARWPEADVVGVDLSAGMIAEATRRAGPRQRYLVADASRLPFDDGSFELVTQVNMIPFFDELARVVAPGGSVAISYSRGPQTPIWVPLDRVDAELARRGFGTRRRLAAADGLALLATKS